ncbi:thiolase family protein [Puniceibacterium sediminis]|uniref:Acetyl-CoA C-acetyltransferase n=1 Tax=Puniceibacterium sediminis TaxID=1608407 RepID=A0A238ZH44_9RHOB|nr:acetyl-CoA C-acyltransferase [Puniceibacterium sediminis]SNR82013.1 acetyl-CoA C-acetyltransferase [Puniceibacterium sediminis]
MTQDVYILGTARTPIGGLLGELSGLSATELGAHSARATVERSGLSPEAVEQCFMGCVLPAGLGQAPARQVALSAGLPRSTQATTVNKMCGSGMQAAILAHDRIKAGGASVILAGGMESMSNAPHLLPRQRQGIKFGNGTIIDSMSRDGLEDAYEPGALMGQFADRSSVAHQVSREELDDFAIMSLERAMAGASSDEIAEVEVTSRRGVQVVSTDQQPRNADIAKIPQLKPAFGPEGRTTAANASSISDGASTMILAAAEAVPAHAPRVRILGHGCYAADPDQFCSAPGFAMADLLSRIGWGAEDVDLYEVNEAFAVVPILAARHIGVSLDKVNIRGGACALGHPIGASGARIVTTLVNALIARGGGRGIASICLGGGEALAMALEVTG